LILSPLDGRSHHIRMNRMDGMDTGKIVLSSSNNTHPFLLRLPGPLFGLRRGC
jgi:hypothetical protein